MCIRDDHIALQTNFGLEIQNDTKNSTSKDDRHEYFSSSLRSTCNPSFKTLESASVS